MKINRRQEDNLKGTKRKEDRFCAVLAHFRKAIAGGLISKLVDFKIRHREFFEEYLFFWWTCSLFHVSILPADDNKVIGRPVWKVGNELLKLPAVGKGGDGQ